MKRKRFTEEQIIKALKEVEGGAVVREVCRRLAVTEQTFYRWRQKYGGMEVNEARRLWAIGVRRVFLSQLFASVALDRSFTARSEV